MHRFLVLLVLVAGCVPVSYAYTPASNKPVVAKPKDCKFDIHTTQPTQGYEEIGILDHYNGDKPKDVEKFRKAIAEQVCQVGGDGVVVTTNDNGFTKASVVRYVNFAEPVKPLTDMPKTQSNDSEVPKK
jgi:hypothetical protein